MARPITAFRSPCMTLCASSSPNRPARPARTQKPPRTSRLLWECAARCIAGCSPRGMLSSPIARYGAPYSRTRVSPAARSSLQNSNATAAAFRPSARFPHETQKPPRNPCFFRGLRGGLSYRYALASVSMAWANILTLSMNFSQSIYSSGIWQVSTSPGKLMPNATVLGIMRE